MSFGSRSTVALLVVVAAVVLLIVGVAVPKLFVGSGVRLYEGEEKNFAEYALWWEPVVRDDPLPFVMARQVAEVEEIPNEGYVCDPNAEVSSPYEARIRLYTLFGVPYGTTVLDCYGEAQVSRTFVVALLTYLTLLAPLMFLGVVAVAIAMVMNWHYHKYVR